MDRRRIATGRVAKMAYPGYAKIFKKFDFFFQEMKIFLIFRFSDYYGIFNKISNFNKSSKFPFFSDYFGIFNKISNFKKSSKFPFFQF